ncbi:hypothetical protein S7711_10706 [Stachybotrys chartarum IBT 7711]|uniref:Uncharacterized protein n=1 Tax=Stachybotrys chartarum (strain CBS 109288 / IBT 7711) TaxID=1280523 RepID=A0A084AXX6_STACB|nr:hypothetical protein S7711_10706 [Stachybotrys chartarum IBT 7711]
MSSHHAQAAGLSARPPGFTPINRPRLEASAHSSGGTSWDRSLSFKPSAHQKLSLLNRELWSFNQRCPGVPLVRACLEEVATQLFEASYFASGWGPFGEGTDAGRKLVAIQEATAWLEGVYDALLEMEREGGVFSGDHAGNAGLVIDKSMIERYRKKM